MSTQKFTSAKKDEQTADAELRAAMDKVMARVTLEDIAKVAGCGVNSLKQARLDPGASGHRKPPASLGRALHEISRERATYFAELAKQLRPSKES